MRCKLSSLINWFLVFIWVLYSSALADELPFGVLFQDTTTLYYNDAHIDTMHLMLGFNAIHPWADSASIGDGSDLSRYASHGMKSYPQIGVDFWKYTHSVYAIVQAEDFANEVRFKLKYNGAGTEIVDGWYKASPDTNHTPFIILDSLSIKGDQKYQVIDLGTYIHYIPALNMKISLADLDTSENQIVAYLKVYAGNWWGENSLYYKDTLGIFPIYSTPFETQNPQIYEFTNQNPSDFWWNPSVNSSYDVITFQLESTDICTLWVDYLKIYDRWGTLLIDSSRYDGPISSYVKPANNPWITNSVSAWYINDEPEYCNFMPVGYVSKLIMDSTQIPSTVVYNAGVSGIDFTFDRCRPYANGYSDFLKLTGLETPWIDIYPFAGGQGCSDSTLFTGTTLRQNASGEDSSCGCTWVLGLQQALNEMTWSFDTIATEFFSMNPPRKWFDMPQAMEWKSHNCDLEGETWARMPTQSEYSCAVFLSLCYGASGLIDYKWDGYCSEDTNPRNLDSGHTFGFVDPGHDWQKSRLWDCQWKRVNPYIKAIDDIYLGLTWEKAYPICPDSTTPGGAWVASIVAFSNNTDPNPDLGWFHVGEYWGNGNEHYIMLVNRACSQGPYDTTEAPSVTATVRFSADNLNLGDYVYVIDMANGTDSSDWVGHQDTTYTSVMADGMIPFTTTLKAGEGKLFKITAATAAPSRFYGNLFSAAPQSSGFTYQGVLKLPGDATIPTNKTLKVKGPALFRMAGCDSLHSGHNTSLVELICNGKLNIQGTPQDSVLMRNIFSCATGSDLNPPSEGDWYGIVDRSNEADTLLYCDIRYPYRGYQADSASHVLIRHCTITKTEAQGVYLNHARYYTSQENIATIDSSQITKNGTNAIYAAYSDLDAENNAINCTAGKSAIYISGGLYGGNTITYLLKNNFLHNECGSAEIGIQIQGDAYTEVEMYGNTVRKYSTGVSIYRGTVGGWNPENGVRFTGLNAIDSNTTYGLWCNTYASPAIYAEECEYYNSFSFNGSYGIYCTDHSSPKVRNTFIRLNNYNVGCASYSLPNLGDSVVFQGNNIFWTSNKDIRNVLSPLQVIKAMYNWWDEDPPDTNDFYPSKAWVNYRHHIGAAYEPCVGSPGFAMFSGGTIIPEQYTLYQNYPNPFNPNTNIMFDLPQDSWVRLSVYNVLGQRIKSITDTQYPAGSYSVRWDGRNESGGEVASGVYFYLLETDNFRDAKKMLMLR